MRRVFSGAVLVAMIATGMFVSPVFATTPPVIYQNVPDPIPGSVLSQAFQAQTVSELGDRIQFEPSTSRLLSSLDVLMSSWGCESGRWENNDCSTTPNLTFDHPITVNFYNIGPSNAVGSLIDTRTQTFAIPYRPSKDDANCTNPGTDSNGGNDLGKWYSAADDTCYNGYTFAITFDLTSLGLTAPDEVIISIAFNTTGYGPTPIGSQACDTPTTGCGYDSLNVGLSSVPANVTFGSNPAPNDAYMKAHVGGSGSGYCTNTDLDSFRLDGSCYGGLKAAFTVYASSAACTTVCYVDDATGNDANGGTSPADAKKTIQGGIDAVDAGGTVIVAAGTYAEHVDINKTVDLMGANAGVAGDATRGAESIVDGGLTGSPLTISDDDVLIDGFEITGGQSAGGSAGVHIFSGASAGWEIANNIVTGNAIGVEANCVSDCTVADNLIDANNEAGPAGGAGLYAEVTNGLTVNSNVFTGHTENNAALFATSSSPSHVSLTFTNNALDNEFGVAVLGVSGGLFEGNTIKTNGQTALAFAGGDSNVDVLGNVLKNNARGVRVSDPFDVGVNSNFEVHRNNVAGNTDVGIGVSGGYVGTLNAECNWWGSFSGPGPVAAGTGSNVTPNVDYSPWLLTSNLAGDCDPNGSITIILQTHPEGSQAFNFTGTNGIAPFTLVDNGTPSNSKTFDVPAGLYVFRIGALPKWALITLTCNLHETILKSHRLVQIQLHSDENVTCTFTESYRKPDALIAKASGGPYSGDNIYSAGVTAAQTLAQSYNPGQTKSFWVKFQNDGLDSDSYRVVSKLNGSLKYKVVFMAGTVEVTGKVNAGTYRLNLAPGATRMIEVRVTAGATVTSADVRNIILTMQSRTASGARDTVKAFVSRTP